MVVKLATELVLIMVQLKTFINFTQCASKLGSRLNDSERDSHTQSPEQNDFASLPRQQVFE